MRRFQALKAVKGLRTPWITRRQASGLVHKSDASPRSIVRNRFAVGLGFGLFSGFAWGIYERHYKKRVASESPPNISEYVDLQPPTDIDPFPATIVVNKQLYQALGTGVRTVTFLNFHVYAVGMYIASDDLHAARQVLAKTAVEPNNVQTWVDTLSDPVKGSNIVDDLLRSNIRFAVRIVPVRNTGFGHLRDGFIKNITSRPEAKALQSPEFGAGINELRRTFSRRQNLHKGEVITFTREASGGLSAWYGDSDETRELLGSPSDPYVGRLFFLQYLAGNKPSSPTLKEKTMQGLSALAVAANA